jgi:putative methyltransferase (TIGR04325 family)
VAEQRRKWPDFVAAVSGAAPLGVHYEASEVDPGDYAAHNTVVSFGYALALSSRGQDRVSLLDWGGGIGHYRLLAQALLPGVTIDYTCKEVPKLAAAGRELHPDAEFVDADDVLERRFDFVLASGSLQYERDWERLLRRFAASAERGVYVARLPVTLGTPSFVVLQRAHAHGYGTEYLGWVLARTELLAAAERAGLELVREFLVSAWFDAAGAPERPTGHRSFLFRPLTAP